MKVYYLFVVILFVYFVIDITIYTKLVTDHEFAEKWTTYSYYKFIVAMVIFIFYKIYTSLH